MPGRRTIQPPHLILGSASPRRKSLLEAMGLKFEVVTQASEESFPSDLNHYEITDYLSIHKASVLSKHLSDKSVLLTADTIVWQGGEVLEKPRDSREASQILRQLSGRKHEVITSVCFTTLKEQRVEHECTEVAFAPLSADEIAHYVENGNPLDKAGAYGIQEWIGLIGVTGIKGSYTNVVGLPTRLVYKTLRDMASEGF